MSSISRLSEINKLREYAERLDSTWNIETYLSSAASHVKWKSACFRREKPLKIARRSEGRRMKGSKKVAPRGTRRAWLKDCTHRQLRQSAALFFPLLPYCKNTRERYRSCTNGWTYQNNIRNSCVRASDYENARRNADQFCTPERGLSQFKEYLQTSFHEI